MVPKVLPSVVILHTGCAPGMDSLAFCKPATERLGELQAL